MQVPSALFSLNAKKWKKSTPQKKFLIFQEMGLSNSNIEKFLIFSQKKAFFKFGENGTPTFQEIEFSSPMNRKFQ